MAMVVVDGNGRVGFLGLLERGLARERQSPITGAESEISVPRILELFIQRGGGSVVE